MAPTRKRPPRTPWIVSFDFNQPIDHRTGTADPDTRLHVVRVTVDMLQLALRFGRRAVLSKRQRVIALHGAVEVRPIARKEW